MRIRRLAAVAAVLAAGSASAYVRETTVPGHPDQGYWLWWNSRSIGYRVNATGSLQYPAPCGDTSGSTFQTAVDNAFAAWKPDKSDLRFYAGPTTTNTAVGNDGMNLVVYRAGTCVGVAPTGDACFRTAGLCAKLYNCWEHGNTGNAETLALTTTTFDLDTGEILDADIEYFGWDGYPAPGHGMVMTCGGTAVCSVTPGYDQPYGTSSGCNWIDVGTLTMHEAGHMLGLDHECQYGAPYDPPSPPGSCPTDSVMNPQIDPGYVLPFVPDVDLAAISSVYPTGKPAVTDNPPPPKKGGCASAGAGELGPLALLALAAFPAWRRRRTW